jgi:hypothetical protein
MPTPLEASAETQLLLGRLRDFGMPGGIDAARQIHAVRVLEKGEMRSAPKAPWMPFTSETTMDARGSNFRWDAKMGSGSLRMVTVTDAYENGQGRLVAKVGGVVPVANLKGPEFDKGELQRYLASIVFCPPVLLHHPTLAWQAVGRRTLRVRDTADKTGATIDLELGEDGASFAISAERPRAVGKRTVLTPWYGFCNHPKEWYGLVIPACVEVAWQLPEGKFTYYRSEITSLEVKKESGVRSQEPE